MSNHIDESFGVEGCSNIPSFTRPRHFHIVEALLGAQQGTSNEETLKMEEKEVLKRRSSKGLKGPEEQIHTLTDEDWKDDNEKSWRRL